MTNNQNASNPNILQQVFYYALEGENMHPDKAMAMQKDTALAFAQSGAISDISFTTHKDNCVMVMAVFHNRTSDEERANMKEALLATNGARSLLHTDYVTFTLNVNCTHVTVDEMDEIVTGAALQQSFVAYQISEPLVLMGYALQSFSFDTTEKIITIHALRLPQAEYDDAYKTTGLDDALLYDEFIMEMVDDACQETLRKKNSSLRTLYPELDPTYAAHYRMHMADTLGDPMSIASIRTLKELGKGDKLEPIQAPRFMVIERTHKGAKSKIIRRV